MKYHLFKTLPNARNIAVRLSGGPDSSIIYYALCDHYRDTDVNIIPYTMASNMRPHLIRKAENVIGITARLTGKLPLKHYTYWHDKHTHGNDAYNHFEYTRGQEMLQDEVYRENAIDMHYTGLSKNCPIDELTAMVNIWVSNGELNGDKCYDSLETRDRERDLDLIGYDDPMSDIGLPFLRYDKRKVYEAYNTYGLLGELFPHTWSCENDSQSLSNDPLHCGTCYFCLERRFAFGDV